MRPVLLLIPFAILIAPSFSRAERFLVADPSPLLGVVAAHVDSDARSGGGRVDLWRDYLSRPHPDVATMRAYFEEAAAEFGVPVALLEAIGRTESNWTQVGPSIDLGWGVMHLVDSDRERTLAEAAELLGLSAARLKDDARQNIRGAAALLKRYAQENGDRFALADWFEAAARFSALGDEALEAGQARRYFGVLRDGSVSHTLWGETIRLAPHPDLAIPPAPEPLRSEDYPGAVAFLTPCNFTEGRNHALDTWVNHWIGVGTYAGAISWFHNCDAQVSAHFVIRNADGEITQVVRVADTAWHCGAYGYPYNNSRSIGVEHEATVDDPDQWSSEPMLQASTTMANYFCNEYGIPMQRALPGIRGHNEMPGTATQCPGNLPWDHWMEYLWSPVAVDDSSSGFAAAPVAWPNPMGPRTRIAFALDRPGPVELAIFDTSGRRVRELRMTSALDAGAHEILWDGRDDSGCGLPSGVYFYRIAATGASMAGRLVLLR